MQDIDFDEIDRAVSSVTSSSTETNSPDVNEATASGFTSVSTPIAPREAPTSFGSPAARRSTGRFMDVVHPSSDMRPTASTAPTAPSVQREVASREDIDRSSVAERTSQSLNPSSAFHWPDPINVPQLPATEPDIAVAPEQNVMPELVMPELLEDVAISPLESPFLADAKVEKRPLGAFSLPESDLPLLEDFNDQFGHIEDMVVEEAEAIEVTEPAQKEELLLEAHTETTDSSATKNSDFEPETLSTTAPTALPGPTSISQQYTEQVSTTSEPTAAIYDTDAYHQALVHQPKKHGKGMILLWIVALILAGGGIGAAVYFFVFPLL